MQLVPSPLGVSEHVSSEFRGTFSFSPFAFCVLSSSVLSPREPFLRSTPTIVHTTATCLHPFPLCYVFSYDSRAKELLRFCVCACVRACVCVFSRGKGRTRMREGIPLELYRERKGSRAHTRERRERGRDSSRTRERASEKDSVKGRERGEPARQRPRSRARIDRSRPRDFHDPSPWPPGHRPKIVSVKCT